MWKKGWLFRRETVSSASWGKPKTNSMTWDWTLRDKILRLPSSKKNIYQLLRVCWIKIDKWLARWPSFIYASEFCYHKHPPPRETGKHPSQSPSFRLPSSPNLRLVRSKEPPPKAVNEILLAPHFGIFVATPTLPRPAVETAMLSQRFLLFWPQACFVGVFFVSYLGCNSPTFKKKKVKKNGWPLATIILSNKK